ncbi:PAS domain S-box protein [Flavobacterium arcticum]|uniref:histidine kinase n=1 Tax=Flavobacterium arcticum TaxID=1784713 RepID=A0A345HE00_9FLAO|nr:PAS domain-containing sensor histidine kinase [Flavobacterium arcticum]AXG74810.1 PAS domain S-box protein [Flavobacterium arcticum]KAF2509692.1 PAS domain S-box protein [Flavobacterium arcticum]
MKLKNKLKIYNYARILSLSVFLLAFLVIIGWILDIPLLKSIMPDYISMKLNTALCFIIMSTSLILETFPKKRTIVILLNVFVATLCILTYSQEVFGYDLGLDQLIIMDLDAISDKSPYPGRMSPITAILFTILSLGLILQRYINKSLIVIQYAFNLVTIMAIIALIGYLYNAPEFYTLSFLTSMAVHTSLGFLLLSIAMSLLHPHLGIMGILTGDKVGNSIARQLFSKICIVIFVFTYLRYLSHKHKLVDTEFGTALLTISFILVSLLIIWEATENINKKDARKRLAEEHFRLVVESAPNALIMSDGSGTIRLVNEQAEKMFGYKRENFIGQKVELIVPNSIKSTHHHNRNGYHKAPSNRYFGAGSELYAKRSDNSEFPVEIGLTPIRTENGTMVLASIIDITKRKKQESIINQQVIELKIKNQEMEQFNYIASHDLQEPLRTLSNYIMLLEEDYPEQINDEIKIHLKTMENAVSRMNLLVRSILDFGRLGRDKKLEYIDSKTIVEDVLCDLSSLINSTGATIIIDTDLPKFNGYEIEFRQLFQNLINNALKFRKKDVPVEINIGCTMVENKYEFYVKDNGIGINTRYNNRVFEIFKRLNKESEFKGDGIGLANCKKIAEMHGGKIWVESTLGIGSTFKFTTSKIK